MNTTSPEQAEILKDIATLQAYRRSRLDFSNRIVEASADKSAAAVSILRSEPMFQVAEFFFLLSGFRIASTEALRDLIDRHNQYLSDLLKDPAKLSRMELTKERVLDAIFDGETSPRVLKLWSEQQGTIDQSSIARLLVTVMSDETTRKVLVTCGKAGFVQRETSVYRLVTVRSLGVLEAIYGDCLRKVRLTVEAMGQGTPADMTVSWSKGKQRRQKAARPVARAGAVPTELEGNNCRGMSEAGRVMGKR